KGLRRWHGFSYQDSPAQADGTNRNGNEHAKTCAHGADLERQKEVNGSLRWTPVASACAVNQMRRIEIRDRGTRSAKGGLPERSYWQDGKETRIGTETRSPAATCTMKAVSGCTVERVWTAMVLKGSQESLTGCYFGRAESLPCAMPSTM